MEALNDRFHRGLEIQAGSDCLSDFLGSPQLSTLMKFIHASRIRYRNTCQAGERNSLKLFQTGECARFAVIQIKQAERFLVVVVADDSSNQRLHSFTLDKVMVGDLQLARNPVVRPLDIVDD